MKTTLYILLTTLVFAFSPTVYGSGGGGGAGGAGGAGAGNYKELTPPFVVNLPDPRQNRFMQVSVAVEAAKEETRKAIDEHVPLLRNNLIMLFSSQDKDIVKSKEGREKLRADAQEIINKALKEVGAPEIDALYFTGLVVQ